MSERNDICETCFNYIPAKGQTTAWDEAFFARCRSMVASDVTDMTMVTVMSPSIKDMYKYCTSVRGTSPKCPNFKEKQNV